MTELELYNQICDSIFQKLENQETILKLFTDMIPAIQKEKALKSDFGAKKIIYCIVDYSLRCGAVITLNKLSTQLQLTDTEIDLLKMIQDDIEIELYNINQKANRPNYEENQIIVNCYLHNKKKIKIPDFSENEIDDLIKH